MPPFLIPGILTFLSLGFAWLAGGTLNGLYSALCMVLATILAAAAIWINGAEAYSVGYEEGRDDEAQEMEDAL